MTYEELMKLNKYWLAVVIVSDNGQKKLDENGYKLVRMFERKNKKDMLATHAMKHIMEEEKIL